MNTDHDDVRRIEIAEIGFALIMGRRGERFREAIQIRRLSSRSKPGALLRYNLWWGSEQYFGGDPQAVKDKRSIAFTPGAKSVAETAGIEMRKR
jgi:hypothetical protein